MNYLLFKSPLNNCYMYSSSKQQFYLLNEITYSLLNLNKQKCNITDIKLDEFSNKTGIATTEQYFYNAKQKIQYYIGNDVLGENSFDLSLQITADTIKYQLANNPHIVFETTEKCNLNCKYCGYGDFYNSFDKRTNKNLEFVKAKLIIDYILEYCLSDYSLNYKNEVDISFYGGEPLLKIRFIKEVINYCKTMESSRLKFNYFMTTNAVLLDKYMDYIVDNNIGILLSLDGNEKNHSYRVYPNGKNSFGTVYSNIKKLKEIYPNYFNSNKVRFNSVLHNRNSVQEINNYIQTEFDKTPLISELNTVFVSNEKKDELFKLYQNLHENIHESEDYYHLINKKDPIQIPDFMEGIHFVFKLLNQVFENYFDLRYNIRYKMSKKVTGTCLPFARKLFVTANGKVLPCENVNHDYAFGRVTNKAVDINLDELAISYNDLHEKIKKQLCSKCFRANNYCSQCLYLLDLTTDKIKCHGFMTEATFSKYLCEMIGFFENYPKHFKTIMDEITID